MPINIKSLGEKNSPFAAHGETCFEKNKVKMSVPINFPDCLAFTHVYTFASKIFHRANFKKFMKENPSSYNIKIIDRSSNQFGAA